MKGGKREGGSGKGDRRDERSGKAISASRLPLPASRFPHPAEAMTRADAR